MAQSTSPPFAHPKWDKAFAKMFKKDHFLSVPLFLSSSEHAPLIDFHLEAWWNCQLQGISIEYFGFSCIPDITAWASHFCLNFDALLTSLSIFNWFV
jgi:hypothetical protein